MIYAWHVIYKGRRIASFGYRHDALLFKTALQERFPDCTFLIEHLEDA